MASSTPSVAECCLLLLGKTGNGKSATGNSILGTKVFKSSSNTESVTTDAAVSSRNVDGRLIKVVDTPGLCDTRYEKEDSADVVMEAFNKGFELCSEGFHALVIVFQYGTRLTDEERLAIELLKEMLGKEMIKEYAILLFTHGDIFDPEEEKTTFKGWCQEQKGFLGELLQECDNRYILFNNRTRDEIEKSRQRTEILNCVDTLQLKGNRYGQLNFHQAKEARSNMKRKQNAEKVTGHVNSVLGEIAQDLLAVDGNTNANFDALRARLSTLIGQIRDEDLDKPKMDQLEHQIENMNQSVYQKEKDLKAQVELQKQKEKLAEEQRRQEEERRRLEEAQRAESARLEAEMEAMRSRKRRRHRRKNACLIQ